ncbi:GTP cyclohydrolase II [Malaciobacter marinus]|jgi:GTP cyclohydrolase II|uniref:GTP cyclohydrolase-2 n=1 Tax=Malaciobacter marinus TaxID=505249 RepID=A0AB36ZVA1_9BACT|nr:GTP cyclohydrolase II [Malaciobacter marinus]PPK61273.1 GTP cyclohydrolase II [Malaciobacter marinus]SKB61082.1 GTP cyclohydrolase II [Malaciobacter marinus]
MNIQQSNTANLPTKYGKFRIKAYKDNNQEHLAIMSLDFEQIEAPYVRIHSECLTGDTLGSLKCDCQNQLELALKFISKEGGLIIYHRQEGRNIGLLNKVNAYALQDQGRNTIEANLELGFKEDERDYKVIKYIFDDLKISKLKLITNNPKKIDYVKSLNIELIERIPSITKVNKYNEYYLNTKKDKMGHLL